MPHSQALDVNADRHLVSAREGHQLTGLQPQTIYRLARQGRIRSFRVLKGALRFDRRDLLALVQEVVR
jgi:hypothetical protein